MPSNPTGAANAMDRANELEEAAAAARAAVERLTDEQRVELFNEWCTSCGAKQPEQPGQRCHCWQDE